MRFGVADPSRLKIDFGLTEADLEPRIQPGTSVLRAQAQRKLALQSSWPEHWAPKPQELPREPAITDVLPRADYLVVTWTVAELEALADVLTPGVRRNSWYRYAHKFDAHYLPQIRSGAPSRQVRRLGSYYVTHVGDAKVLCFKSELHLNQDGIMQQSGYATLPVRDLFRQLIEEVQPRLVITVGTAGATNPDHFLGDVYITRAAKFRCQQEFEKAPFNNQVYKCDFPVPTEAMKVAGELLRLQDEHLIEPDFAPPTRHYAWEGPALPGTKNRPAIRIDGGGRKQDFKAFLPMLSTDFFEFGTTQNNLWKQGCAVEMGDAALGLAALDLGPDAPNWLVIRNASDPAINAALPRTPRELDMQAHWAVWYYEAFGYWTSVNSAIAVWAVIAGDQGFER
jgi:nucleoside phosphorylase